jgi:RNA polymerase-associated protein LEO1
VKIDSKPFHPDTYYGPDDEDPEQVGQKERSMSIRLAVENTVRWKWSKDKNGLDVSSFVAHH